MLTQRTAELGPPQPVGIQPLGGVFPGFAVDASERLYQLLQAQATQPTPNTYPLDEHEHTGGASAFSSTSSAPFEDIGCGPLDRVAIRRGQPFITLQKLEKTYGSYSEARPTHLYPSRVEPAILMRIENDTHRFGLLREYGHPNIHINAEWFSLSGYEHEVIAFATQHSTEVELLPIFNVADVLCGNNMKEIWETINKTPLYSQPDRDFKVNAYPTAWLFTFAIPFLDKTTNTYQLFFIPVTDLSEIEINDIERLLADSTAANFGTIFSRVYRLGRLLEKHDCHSKYWRVSLQTMI